MYKLTELKNGLEGIQGFFCGAANVGMRTSPSGSHVSDLAGDVAFIRSEKPCDISAIFTSNKFQAAPIRHYLKYPKNFQTNFVLMNAKNANAMTGEEGIRDIDNILSALSSKIDTLNPVMSSTGVIGYRLPVDKIVTAFDKFDFNSSDSDKTAKAIMTTDQFKKELAYKVVLNNGDSFSIAGICKGAGMINPAMATMLCFIITDANIPKADMDKLLRESTEESFNRISVDGDTSTNDTVMLLSNKKSQIYDKDAFSDALKKMMFELAMMVLRDGEGASKLVTFEVKGAKDDADAQKISTALSNSLLVKTALFGEDPNWGRIASTVGASGAHCDEEKLVIHYDNLLIYSNESRELSKERESKAFEIMKQDNFRVVCDLGLGEGKYSSYGCDLSYEYVKINAEYRT